MESKPSLARSLEYIEVSLATFWSDLSEIAMENDPHVNS